jgi:S-adenosyl methyltransferase
VTEPPEIDVGVPNSSWMPNSARIWNDWLGGKDNDPVDREAGEQFRAVFPKIVEVAHSSRALLGRAVRRLAGQAGIRQFQDIGPACHRRHHPPGGPAGGPGRPGSSRSTTTRWSWTTTRPGRSSSGRWTAWPPAATRCGATAPT